MSIQYSLLPFHDLHVPFATSALNVVPYGLRRRAQWSAIRLSLKHVVYHDRSYHQVALFPLSVPCLPFPLLSLRAGLSCYKYRAAGIAHRVILASQRFTEQHKLILVIHSAPDSRLKRFCHGSA